MAKIFKSKNWSVRFASDMGATFITCSGNVPEAVKKSAAELVKKNVPQSVASKIFKTQFKELITAETEE